MSLRDDTQTTSFVRKRLDINLPEEEE